jgi:phage pi2 protein 07
MEVGIYKESNRALYSFRMNIKDVLSRLQQEQSVLVKNLSFDPDTVDQAILDTGESVYWVRNESGRWLSIDIGSDEMTLFEEIDENVEQGDDSVVFQNKDYEFSYEGSGKIVDEEGTELEVVTFKDYEGEGEILRIVMSEVTGERTVSVGEIVPEDDVIAP